LAEITQRLFGAALLGLIAYVGDHSVLEQWYGCPLGIHTTNGIAVSKRDWRPAYGPYTFVEARYRQRVPA
jgi:hypothetical protein